MLGFVTFATHKRIVAEKDAEIAGLMKRCERIATIAEACQSRNSVLNDKCDELVGRVYTLQARLAPFTKIRNRDSRGRFIKDTVA